MITNATKVHSSNARYVTNESIMQHVVNYIFIFVYPAESKKNLSDFLWLCELSTRQCRPTFICEEFFMIFIDNLSPASHHKGTVRSQTRGSGICEAKSDSGTSLNSSPSVSPYQYHSTNVPFL